MSEYINQLSKSIHKGNVDAGWWTKDQQCLYQKLQLVSSEVSESMEGARKGLKDDHLPQYPMEIVELADALIRGLDLGGRLKLNYKELQIDFPLIGKKKSAGSNFLQINIQITDFAKALYVKKEESILSDFYSSMIESIFQCTTARGYSVNKLMEVTAAKVDYNKIRKDHKLENRNKGGGKKF